MGRGRGDRAGPAGPCVGGERAIDRGLGFSPPLSLPLTPSCARHLPTPRVFLGDWTVAASLGRADSGLSGGPADVSAPLVRPPPPSPRRLLRSRHKATAAAAAAEWTERAGGGDGGDDAAAAPLARRRQSIARSVSVRRPAGARVAPA